MQNEPEFVGRKRQSRRAARSGDRPALRTGGQTDPTVESNPSQSLWDVAGVAGYLNVPVSSVYKMTARKTPIRIPHIRIGNKLRFKRTDVDQWLTLLTTSNLTALSKMRQKASQVADGDPTPTQASRR